MKKIFKHFLAATLVLALALAGISCSTAPADTVTPTPTPTTTTPTPTPTDPKPTTVDKMKIAEDFIKNSSTFKYDGIEGSIKLVNAEDGTTTAFPSRIFTFKFQTGHPGHGDRTGQFLAQVITDHTVIITANIMNDTVYSAVCDNTWDMLTDKELVTLISDEAAQKSALEFLQNTATFKFDGIEGSIEFVKSGPSPISSFFSKSFTFNFQTRHPGHGDRTGQVLAQVVTDHTAELLVNLEKGEVAWAVCDQSWDLIKDHDLPVQVSGFVISGGDTTPTDGPQDAPRVFIYKLQKTDGTFVNVSYTAYPPSPVGDANKAKIKLEFYSGTVNIGDRMEAYGMMNKETNTLEVINEGNFIRTFVPKLEINGIITGGGDTAQPDGPMDVPHKFVYKVQKEDGSTVDIGYTAYPPSPAGDAAMAKITLNFYNSDPQPGDYLKAYGTYDVTAGTLTIVDEGDFIKTYPVKP